jgi:hypothetical protein
VSKWTGRCRYPDAEKEEIWMIQFTMNNVAVRFSAFQRQGKFILCACSAAMLINAPVANAGTSTILQRLNETDVPVELTSPAHVLDPEETQEPVLLKTAVQSESTAVGQADKQSAAQPVTATTGESVKADEVKPGRFRKALRERDFSVGFGKRFPLSRFKERTNVEIFQLLPRWGRFRNSHQEFLWEVPLTYASNPESAYAAGLTLMFRHHFSSNRSFAPFIEIGSGFVFTNFDKFPEVGGGFQFTPQAGFGFRKSISKSGDLVASARIFHMSNGGLRRPNTGLNNYLITLGYSKLF